MAASDDELLPDGDAGAPQEFTFQSDLSDDDAPDPLGLDLIASASLAALNEKASPPPKDEETASAARALVEEEEDRGAPAAHSSVEQEDAPRPQTTADPTENAASSFSEGRPRPRLVDIEVCLPWMPASRRAEYQKIWVEEYRGPTRRRHRDDVEDGYAEQFGTRKRKHTDDDYVSYDDLDQGSDEDDDLGGRPHGLRWRPGPMDEFLESGSGRRSARASTRASSLFASSEGEHALGSGRASRSLRPRASVTVSRTAHYDDRDELQDSDGDDPTFAFVQSDIVQTKRRKRLKRLSTRGRLPRLPGRSVAPDFDIEFESRRRSSRANKATRVMADSYPDDEDIYYVEEEKAPSVPKVASVREIFQAPASYEFKDAHRLTCDSCGYNDDRNKGPLIPCQGCSNSYHKACIGVRSTRDHRVTKVAADSFVLQCRFCIGVYKRRDVRAPAHDVCQGCRTKNPSCIPFSERKTPKQEEILRNENGGVDPITPVDPKLLDNPDNVLFRCGRCHRAWHYEHLPHPVGSRDPAIDDPLNLRKHRREEYQITWMCKTCQDTEEDKVDRIVAWRPVDPKSYSAGQWITDLDEDNLEYLVKWENKSYNHCVWLPGAWVYGIVKAAMRQSFVKRALGEGSEVDGERQHADSLLRWTEKEAIHDAWITPDIVLDVHYVPRSREDEKKYRAKSARDRFEDDLSRVFHVIKIYVKFEGLGYDDAVWDTPPSPDAGPVYEAFLEAYREYLNGKHFQSEPWRAMKERIEDFYKLDFVKDINVEEQPKGLRRGELMKYQLDGLNWMLYNFRHKRSVILADEMGLGKTVQVVALLSSLIQDNPRIWPFLIVVPNATCANWRREIKKWAPDLRVVAYYGGRVSQQLALNYELFPNGSREMKAHVVIMSYDSAKDSDTRTKFSSTKWAGLVVDEAQALKNDENSLYKALSVLRVPFKLLLTGTPLQNNKRELFNLLQFIDPSLNAVRLDEQFAQITSDNLPELHDLIRPYFLRRTKAMVLTFLPPMAQIIVPVSMSVLQEQLCKSIMERNPQLIRSIFVQSKMKSNERGMLSNILMQLRKCLCHPFIYSQAIEDRNAAPEVMRRNLVEASSKLMLLEIMLPKLKERDHRVLLFSQFLDQLTILEDFLAGMGLKYERLDGSASSMEKQKKIDAFNAPDSDIFAMLLSTRAGGVGINLATADTVIILDPDWNPHQDIQALSRAHRIGQRKKVLCFQLMTVDSAEEKILQIGRKKLALDHLLIETMDNQDEAPNDVESVLKHGAAALFGEGKKKDAITYDSAAVDKLLDRSMMEETKTNEDKSAESAFAFARVWANDEGALAEDLVEKEQSINLSVWDQILQQRAEEARLEEELNRQQLGRGGRRRGAANYISPRFEFDEAQEGAAAADSDRGDGDADFVGTDKSDGDTTDDEPTPATGESTPLGSNSRRPQAKGSQAAAAAAADTELDAHKAARKSGNGDGGNSKGDKPKETTTVAVFLPTAGQNGPGKDTQNAYKQKRGPGRPRKSAGASIGRQAAAGTVGSGSGAGGSAGAAAATSAATTGAATTAAGGAGAFSVDIPSLGAFGGLTLDAVSHPGAAFVPNPASVFPLPGLLHVTPLPSSTSLATTATSGIIPASFMPVTSLPSQARSATTTTTATATTATAGAGVGARGAYGDPIEECFVCPYAHPRSWECPEMRSEKALRLAMDRLRVGAPGLDPAVVVERRASLREKLAWLKKAAA